MTQQISIWLNLSPWTELGSKKKSKLMWFYIVIYFRLVFGWYNYNLQIAYIYICQRQMNMSSADSVLDWGHLVLKVKDKFTIFLVIWEIVTKNIKWLISNWFLVQCYHKNGNYKHPYIVSIKNVAMQTFIMANLLVNKMKHLKTLW